MKKKVGLADSPFFAPPARLEGKSAISVFPASETSPQPPLQETEQDQSPNHGIVVSRYHDTMIEYLRRSVKEFGKEAATHRFTLSEKRAISSIVHSLGMQGIRTTENEITRIAVNYFISEYNQKGKDSLLGLVLQALNK